MRSTLAFTFWMLTYCHPGMLTTVIPALLLAGIYSSNQDQQLDPGTSPG
ncbi:hypothetical protein MK852_00895 [Shewanella benthica]|nr:hypothetical protein [Shewanella benthica]